MFKSRILFNVIFCNNYYMYFKEEKRKKVAIFKVDTQKSKSKTFQSKAFK